MFDIEEKMEMIPDPKTKKLFEEVYSSYQHGNYRSAVVMLWSVVVADIIFKLKFLDDTYRNKKAITILKDIKKRQEEHPESSEWEKNLLKKAYEELKFITLNDKINLEYLHTQRNLSAHPILTDDNLLLAPSKDTTRSLIRNAMEAILLKTALLHKELVECVVEDLANYKDRLGGYENIQPYIQKRFFPNIPEGGAIKILRALWRFVFDPRSQEEKENKEVNLVALLVFFEKYKKQYILEIRENTSYYQVKNIKGITEFLKCYPEIYNILDDALKTLIKASVSKIQDFFECEFLSPNLEEHYQTILSRLNNNETLEISLENLKICLNKAKEKEVLSLFNAICIKLYSKSMCFNDADNNYYHYISPFLSDYTLSDILLLVQETNDKSQVCNRGQAYYNHKEVLKRFYDLGGNKEQLQNFNNWKNWNFIYLRENERADDGMATN